MLYSIIAMAPAGGGAGGAQGGGGGLLMWLPMILIFAIMYFLILRPQAKRQKEQQNMLQALTKGDKIVTTGGIHGTILSEKENILVVKIADSVKVEIERGAVARKVNTEGGSIKPK